MADTSSRLLVACFCAAWCRTCDDYAHVINALKTQYSLQVEFAWIDIEDQADVLDNIDVENFPTLLISDSEQIYFWGTVLPHAATASQLVDRVLSGDIRPIDESDICQLDQRLRSFLYARALLTNK
jgi:thioredoxin 1